MHTNTYNEKIKPLMEEIELICKESKIPMFSALCLNVDNNHEGTYVTHVISPSFLGVDIKNDNIADCFKVFNGYTPVYNETKGMSFGDSVILDIEDNDLVEEVILDDTNAE